jgi:drug/metabolite transporter (DMT)-like permease
MPQAHAARRPLLGIGALCLTVAMWGMSGVAIKVVASTGLVTALYRLWFAIPLLWLSALAPPFRRRLDRRWLGASIVGGALFSVHQMLYFTSLKLTTVADVTIIGALQPALVLLVAGPMFGERADARSVTLALLAAERRRARLQATASPSSTCSPSRRTFSPRSGSAPASGRGSTWSA